LSTNGPVRFGAIFIFRRAGIQNVGKASILERLTLKVVLVSACTTQHACRLCTYASAVLGQGCRKTEKNSNNGAQHVSDY
jgi:hypothetical protein